MSKAFPLPPDAQARIDMLHGLSESRTSVQNGAHQKLQHSAGEPTIDDRATENDHRGYELPELPTAAALVVAEIVLADLRRAKELPA